ncbi:MerR family transcriptional regulator [Microbacterium sp. MYb62]|uniref:MerR family transcriptional regulator n=1 Tax=Microbacterium sp. MYb62 TaxID=1848690 RepID=UPI000CFB9C2E|nr:MerR family transcriptional regulator [Microbacterium sp. MYb62]PRB14217.1 MerR family transcriptional regulator [Microbacterium sp. MYb62]
MRIGSLSAQTGVSVRLLRYYEEQGLLQPSRRPSGYREYSEEDVRTVRNIRRMLAAGLNTRTIAALLPCMVGEGQSLAPGCAGLLPDIERERARIDESIADLMAARSVLDAIEAAAPPEQVVEAHVFEDDECAATPFAADRPPLASLEGAVSR